MAALVSTRSPPTSTTATTRGKVDGFAGAYFFPGQFYDYRWPMVLAGHDSINADARDPRASTPCSLGETLMIADPNTGIPVAKACDPATHTVNIPGDWRELMSTHWFHDHMIDRTSENVYKGNAAMMNYYSGIDRGKEGFRCDYDDTPHPGQRQPLLSQRHLAGLGQPRLRCPAADCREGVGLSKVKWPVAMAGGLNEDGFLGDRMTVNWLYEPYLEVRPRQYRFRILNGAVARFFKFAIVEQVSRRRWGAAWPCARVSIVSYNRVNYHMIANDGNIMEHAIPLAPPTPMGSTRICRYNPSPNAYDVVIDFSQLFPGTRLYMVNTLTHDDGRGPKGVESARQYSRRHLRSDTATPIRPP